MKAEKIPDFVASSAQLASLLEVSGYPKPGNVHRTKDFSDLRYEHFLAGGVAIGESVRKSAEAGLKVGRGEIDYSEAGIGEKINRGVRAVLGSHNGGNTHLGILLLFVPLAVSAGRVLWDGEGAKVKPLREHFDRAMKSTTSEDSLEVYEAVRTANGISGGEGVEGHEKSSWLGKEEKSRLSVTDEGTRDRLSREEISLYDWMEVSAGWDGIARAMTSGLEASMEVGLPALKEAYEKTGDINVAIVHSYLGILSEYPDTFIARKIGLEETPNIAKAVEMGMEKAKEISGRSGSVLEAGGLTTEEGRKELRGLDKDLQGEDGGLNPGTTADLTAVSIMVALLQGLKY